MEASEDECAAGVEDEELTACCGSVSGLFVCRETERERERERARGREREGEGGGVVKSHRAPIKSHRLL